MYCAAWRQWVRVGIDNKERFISLLSNNKRSFSGSYVICAKVGQCRTTKQRSEKQVRAGQNGLGNFALRYLITASGSIPRPK